MRILVTTASRHSTTTDVGDAIADVLRGIGHEVGRQTIAESDDVASVLDVRGYDAVVLGGSVYTGAWLQRATTALELLLAAGVRTYAFAVGVLDVTKDVTDVRWTAPRTSASAGQRVVFGGRISREGLSMRERSLLAVVRAKEGEYTDWSAVRAWADAVGSDLARVHTAA